jgi:hypothetical protein
MSEGLDEDAIHLARMKRTAARFKGMWLENVKVNAPKIKKHLGDLWWDEGGIEVVSLAAGPSLGEDVEKIKEKRKGRELVCVDAALIFSLENGLIPDYIVGADCKEEAAGFLLKAPKTDLPLVLNVSAHPSVAENWKGPIYWYVTGSQVYDLDHKEMVQEMHSKISGVGTVIFQGGNVSSVSLAFALSIRNADKVYLYGHDFCWKDAMYCGGQMKDLERKRIESESAAGTISRTVNARGEAVWSNLSLRKFAEWHDEVALKMRGRVVAGSGNTIMKFGEILGGG